MKDKKRSVSVVSEKVLIPKKRKKKIDVSEMLMSLALYSALICIIVFFVWITRFFLGKIFGF